MSYGAHFSTTSLHYRTRSFEIYLQYWKCVVGFTWQVDTVSLKLTSCNSYSEDNGVRSEVIYHTGVYDTENGWYIAWMFCKMRPSSISICVNIRVVEKNPNILPHVWVLLLNIYQWSVKTNSRIFNTLYWLYHTTPESILINTHHQVLLLNTSNDYN